MIATIVWFLLGNPFGIDNAYVALVLPLVVMGASSLLDWMRPGASNPKRKLS
jgi:SSS family solute:Na+ symporter